MSPATLAVSIFNGHGHPAGVPANIPKRNKAIFSMRLTEYLSPMAIPQQLRSNLVWI